MKEQKMDITEAMAMYLDAFNQVAGDLRFLHGVMHVENGDEDERRKVEIALPYLEQKAEMIETLVLDMARELPKELREKYKLEDPEEVAT